MRRIGADGPLANRALATLAFAALGLATTGCGLSVLVGVVTATQLTGGSGKSSVTPTPVSVTTPTATTFDRVSLAFVLRDSLVRSLDVAVDYSLDGGSTFAPATEAEGAPSQGHRGLSVSRSGNPHLFVWNSFADLDPQGITHSPTVVVRVTAFASGTAPVTSTASAGLAPGAYGLAATTEPFSVDNRLIATVAGSPSSDGEGLSASAVPLLGPEAAVTGPDAAIVVADTGNSRIRSRDRTTLLVTTLAGTATAGFGGDGGPASAARLLQPEGLAVDTEGDLLFSDSANARVRHVDISTRVVTTLAGTGVPGYTGDGGPATSARIGRPVGLVQDAQDTVYFADALEHVVRSVDVGGTIRTVAGTGHAGSAGDGGPATRAQLSAPRGLGFDGSGALLIADTGNHAVRRLRSDGTLETIAGTLGTRGLGGEDESALASPLASPAGVCAVGGTVYVSDSGNNRIRAFVPGGKVATAAGSLSGASGFAGDGGPAVASLLSGPTGVSPDGAGGILVADTGNNRVRRIEGSGSINTVVGSGSPDPANVGDGGPPLGARFLEPSGLAVAPDGSIVESDGTAGNRVRRYALGGAIATIAGTGNPGLVGDGGPATRALVNGSFTVDVDSHGVVFVGEDVNARVRAINPITGTIATVLGGGTGPDGVATLTSIVGTEAVRCVPGQDVLLVSDTRGHAVRRLSYVWDPVSGDVTNGVSDTVAGTTNVAGFSGDGGPATAALLDQPFGLDVDLNGNVYVLDQFAACVRRFQVGGPIATVCGDPTTCGYGGDGGPAVAARICGYFLAIDRNSGDIYVSDYVNNRVRRFKDGGTIQTVFGNGQAGEPDAGGLATSTTLAFPAGLAVLSDGSLLVSSDSTRQTYTLRKDGTFAVIAGRSTSTAVGDGGPAVAAEVDQPLPAVAPDGTLYISEIDFGRVRRVDPRTGLISTIAGRSVLGVAGDGGSPAAALVDECHGVTVDSKGRVLLGQFNAGSVRLLDAGAGTIETTIGRKTTTNGNGDDGPAVAASFQSAEGVAVSPTSGAIYVVDSYAGTVRRIDPNGTISTVAGGGTDASEGVPATTAALANPTGVSCDASEQVSVSLRAPTSAVRRFSIGGTIRTVAGVPGQSGFNGDEVAAIAALLDDPRGLANDAAGNLYIADSLNDRVRKVDAQGIISTVAGTGDAGSGPDGVPASISKLNGPRQLAIDLRGNFYVGEEFGNRVRRFRLFP